MRNMGLPRLSYAFGRRHSKSDAWRYLFICQAGWFVCVIGAARGVGWLGVLFAFCMVGYHLARAARPWREAQLVVVTIVVGWIWESILVQAGLLVYPNGTLIAGTAPYWMVGLWALFAVQFNVLFVWLRSRLLLAAALGAVAGPVSFRAGAALGAVHFQSTGKALVALAFGWSILLPACLALARRWDGIHAND
jgi:hypothetical protein